MSTSTQKIISILNKLQYPCYVYDGEAIKNNYSDLRNSLSVEIFYSLKANPNVHLVNLLRSQGAKAEICSLGELEIAKKAGFNNNEIIFVGPCKTKYDLITLLNNDLDLIVLESLQEFKLLADLTKSMNKKCHVLLRVNPHITLDKSIPIKMGGVSTQFGIDEQFLRSNLKEFKNNSENIIICGFHFYLGSRILDAQAIINHTQKIIEVALDLGSIMSIEVTTIDIGGGFGIPYFQAEENLDLSILKKGFIQIRNNLKQKSPKTNLVSESGRFLVGNSGYFICQVHDVKSSFGKEFIITDGGMHCHMAATGSGSFIRRNFQVSNLSNLESNNIKKYEITGRLCTPSDVLATNIELPVTKIGDYLAIHNSGAYGLSASPAFFLSFGFPKEYLLLNNKCKQIRKSLIPLEIASLSGGNINIDGEEFYL